jgi:hypothetical protein
MNRRGFLQSVAAAMALPVVAVGSKHTPQETQPCMWKEFQEWCRDHERYLIKCFGPNVPVIMAVDVHQHTTMHFDWYPGEHKAGFCIGLPEWKKNDTVQRETLFKIRYSQARSDLRRCLAQRRTRC